MRKIKNVIVKVIIVLFLLSSISMVMAASPFLSNSPVISKVLDTIAVSGLVCFFAAGTVASAYTINNCKNNHFAKLICYSVGISAGAASFGFIAITIIKSNESSFNSYYLALIVGMVFLILIKKILKTTFVKNKS